MFPDPTVVHPSDPSPQDPEPSAEPIPASGFQVRGIVVDGESAAVGHAFGVGLFRLGLLVVLIALVWIYQDQIAAGMVSLLLPWILPIIVVVVIVGWMASRVGGSCLGALLGGAVFRGRSRRREDKADGWELIVETDAGLVSTRVPAELPLDGGEEVVISGPNFGGVKQAWLIQVVSPRPTTRVGRGLIGILVTLFVVVPIIVIVLAV